jgi:hypothetical protein
MIMKRGFLALTFALIFIVAGILSGCGPKKTELSAADQQKLAALGDARKNGILTQTEYDAKVKELNAAAASASSAAGKPASSAADAQKLQALESACKSGVLSPDECAAKRAALTGASSASDSGQGVAPASGLAVVSAPTDAPAAAPSADNSGNAQPASAANAGNAVNDSSNASMAGGGSAPNNPQMSGNGGNASNNAPMAASGGNTYNDPQGAFSIVIPQGWTASPQGDNGAGGVQIAQGASWAVISPFANVKQPSDVVINIAGQLQTQYKNMTIGQHGPSKFNGHLDMAFAMYTGINPKGAAVSIVIIGIAAPAGRYFAVMSSIPQSDTQGANRAMSAMVQSLHFAGE